MQRYLDRNAYDQLLKWKQRANYATLEVSGARQVGKTYIVNEKPNPPAMLGRME